MTGRKATIFVVGAGAVGSFLAGQLYLAGEPVVLVARGQRLQSLQRDGLRLEVEGAPGRIVLPAVATLESTAPAGLVLFCTKADDLAGALDLAAPVVGADTALLLVQNGVEAPAMAAARFPDAAVIAGRVHGFFELEGDLVRHVGVLPSLELGAIGPEREGAAKGLAGMFSRSGVITRIAADIQVSLWSKFLLAASLGGVALACDLPAGRVPQDAAAKALLAAAMAEVRDLAVAEGIDLPADVVESTLAFAANFPANATTSLQRDVMSGRPSEYDFLPGAVLRIGRKLGIRTPCFDHVDRLVASRLAELRRTEILPALIRNLPDQCL